MGEARRREVLRAQETHGPEYVAVFHGLAAVHHGQHALEHLDEFHRVEIGQRKCRLDLLLNVEATRDAGQNRFELAPSARHLVQEGRDVAQGGRAPEILKSEHVQQDEPAALGPDLAPDATDEVRLADAGLTDQNAAAGLGGEVLGGSEEVVDRLGDESVVGPTGRRLRVAPHAVERPDPVEVRAFQRGEFGRHHEIEIR